MSHNIVYSGTATTDEEFLGMKEDGLTELSHSLGHDYDLVSGYEFFAMRDGAAVYRAYGHKGLLVLVAEVEDRR